MLMPRGHRQTTVKTKDLIAFPISCFRCHVCKV
jgi:hypothetical protein